MCIALKRAFLLQWLGNQLDFKHVRSMHVENDEDQDEDEELDLTACMRAKRRQSSSDWCLITSMVPAVYTVCTLIASAPRRNHAECSCVHASACSLLAKPACLLLCLCVCVYACLPTCSQGREF